MDEKKMNGCLIKQSFFLLVAADGKKILGKISVENSIGRRIQWNFGENFAENYGVKIWERKIFGKLWRNQEEKKTLIRR